MAERVVDKERSNSCEYFVPRGSSLEKASKDLDAKEALEALFKK
jgi:hypothetical protein